MYRLLIPSKENYITIFADFSEIKNFEVPMKKPFTIKRYEPDAVVFSVGT